MEQSKQRARDMLKKQNPEYKMAMLIIKEISNRKGISYEDMRKITRKEGIVVARQLCMDFIKRKTQLTEYQIGELFNQKHSTVNHAINKAIPSWLKKHHFKLSYDAIERSIDNINVPN